MFQITTASSVSPGCNTYSGVWSWSRKLVGFPLLIISGSQTSGTSGNENMAETLPGIEPLFVTSAITPR
ncbi:Uncharacterised protein [Mycobacteroides abscessus subsp. abscessus]|nr:Uncharacterised protein [Mycobacteroides abscessus subsp. abscessus]